MNVFIYYLLSLICIPTPDIYNHQMRQSKMSKEAHKKPHSKCCIDHRIQGPDRQIHRADLIKEATYRSAPHRHANEGKRFPLVA